MGSGAKILCFLVGQSGAGVSTAGKALADSGFYVIDNLPSPLIETTIASIKTLPIMEKYRGIAFCLRFTSATQIDEFWQFVSSEDCSDLQRDLVFLKCDRQELLTRFNETRRLHTWLGDSQALRSAIEEEFSAMRDLQVGASEVIDTTHLSPHALSAAMEKRYDSAEFGRRLQVSIVSFGFKHGHPSGFDAVIDVRFLKNPYFEKSLREKTGMDAEVREYIMRFEESQEFLEKMASLVLWLLPRYYAEGKHYFRLGIGCTGGRHRSVCMAEMLAQRIRESEIGRVDTRVEHLNS